MNECTKKNYLAFGDQSALQYEYKIAIKLEPVEDKLEMLAAI